MKCGGKSGVDVWYKVWWQTGCVSEGVVPHWAEAFDDVTSEGNRRERPGAQCPTLIINADH